jgi:ferredoxin
MRGELIRMGRGKRSVALFADTSKYKNIMCKSLNVPLICPVMKRVMDAKGTVFTYVPVYESVEVAGGTALPITIAEHFIREASHHVLLNYCLCRKAHGCKEYDISLGCTFVGEGAREISPEVGKHVSRQEALDRLHEAAEAGLVPVVGKIKFDAIALGVKDHARLMTICHCCPCCCLTGGLQYAPKDVRDIIVRLEGVEVKVTGECSGCGTCIEVCIFKQMKLIDGQAVVGEECKGCGRCAVSCPDDAISITVDNPEYIGQCIKRISAYVDVR